MLRQASRIVGGFRWHVLMARSCRRASWYPSPMDDSACNNSRKQSDAQVPPSASPGGALGYTTIAGRAVGEIEEKKSRFIASLAHVESEAEALSFLEEIRAANRMARHNVYAYILRSAEGPTPGDVAPVPRVRYSDDGEPQKTAGLPTLQVLQHAGLTDVVAVVTRYFGGVLLGTGGLVRAYTQATQAAVEAAELVVVSRCVDLTVRTTYSNYEPVLRIAVETGAKPQDTVYDDGVTLHLRMLAGTQTPFLQKLTELERGAQNVVVSDPLDAAF